MKLDFDTIKMNPIGYDHSVRVRMNDARKQKIVKALEQNKKTGMGLDI